MPGRRTGSKTYRKRNTRRVQRKRVPSNKTLNKKIKNIENNLIELKHHDYQLQSTNFGATSAYLVSGQNYIVPGADSSQRVGNEVMTTSLSFNLLVTPRPNQQNDTLVRMIVFWDRQSNGDAPPLFVNQGVGEQVALLDNTIVTATNYNIFCPLNAEGFDRFSVLYDKIYNITPSVTNTTTPATGVTTVYGVRNLSLRKHIKLSRRMRFTNAAPGPDSISSNAVYIALIAESETFYCTVRGSVRLNYRDA